MIDTNERLRMNISGKIFEIYEKHVTRYPLSLLGNADERQKYYDHARNEYFFDRNGEAFEGILFFYQSNGRIKCPMFVNTGLLIKFFSKILQNWRFLRKTT
jgi:hypothetical protein